LPTKLGRAVGFLGTWIRSVRHCVPVREARAGALRQDEPGMLSSIKDEALQSAVIDAILREAADHAGDSG